MIAIEVEKWLTSSKGYRYRKGSTWHWLNERDPGRTRCGRVRLEMIVVAEHEIEQLPELEACRGCSRALDEWARKRGNATDLSGVTAAPREGRVRKTGPLYHGTRRR